MPYKSLDFGGVVLKILVLNCGSSSVKYQLFNMEDEKVLAKGIVERVGLVGARIIHIKPENGRHTQELEVSNHEQAIELVLKMLIHREHGILESFAEISGVGHRVVHGGNYSNSVRITPDTIKAIAELIRLAPLHNEPALKGIQACIRYLEGIPQVAVFDTSFHQTLPEYAYTYCLPWELSQKYGLRRYGFHGTSHRYVAQRASELVRRPLSSLKVITCHLGNGSSITAIARGRSVDTSMGFTPLAGLPMGTRCGDIDPAIVTFLMQNEGYKPEMMEEILYKRSGILGVSGLSSDFRDIEEAMRKGNDRARLAWDIFVYSVKKYIGSYVAALNGLDVLVFTGGLGENSVAVRENICQDMDYLGIKIDKEQNNKIRGEEGEITAPRSRVRVFVIPTNEELMIARETKANLLEQRNVLSSP